MSFRSRLAWALLSFTTWVGCSAQDAVAPAKEAPHSFTATIPHELVDASEPESDDVRDELRLADGRPNYDALRARYGAPNVNVKTNPRATNVGETKDFKSVKVLPDSLVFPAETSKWLLEKQPGDTLVCGLKCGPTGFLRNIVSISQNGNEIEVKTVNGKLTDVFTHGWVHIESPVRALSIPGLTPPPDTSNINKTQSTTSPETNTSVPKMEWKPGGKVSGSFIPRVPKAMAGFVWDFAFDGPSCSWSAGCNILPIVRLITLEVVSDFQATFDASLSVGVAYTGEKVWKLIPGTVSPEPVHIATEEVPVGPVPVVIIEELELELKQEYSVSGAAKTSISASYERTSTQGFTYTNPPTPTKGSGFKLVNKSVIDKSATITAALEGEAEAGTTLEVKVPFLIYGLAGPFVYVDLGAAAKLKVEAAEVTKIVNGKSTTECEAGGKGGVFVSLSGGVGGEIEMPANIWSTSVQVDLTSTTIPNPSLESSWPITFPLPTAIKTALCGAEEGTGVEDAGPPKPPACKCSDGTVCPDKVHTSSCPVRCVCPSGRLCPGTTTSSCPQPCKCPNGSACPDGANTSSCPAPCTCPNGTACPDGAHTSSCPAPCTCPDGSACPGSTTSTCPTPCTCPDGSTCPGSTTASCNTQTCTCPDGSACPGSTTATCPSPCTCPDGSACPDGSNTSSCVSSSCMCADGSECPNGQWSQCSSCTCSSGGDSCCAGGCPNYQTDRNNCGYCGKACVEFTGDPTSQCVQGDCTCHCPDGSLCDSTNVSTCP